MTLNKTVHLWVIMTILLTSVTFSYGQNTKKNKKKIELCGYVIDAKSKAGPDSVL